MAVTFHSDAEQELRDAYAWYEGQQIGLGLVFADAIFRAVSQIENYPRAWQSIEFGLRKYGLGRFPYSIVYEHVGDDIVVYAIAHQRRDPGYWHKRV